MVTNATPEMFSPKAVALPGEEIHCLDRVLQIQPMADYGDDDFGPAAGLGGGERPQWGQLRQPGYCVSADARSCMSQLSLLGWPPPPARSRRCGHVDGPAARPQAHSAATGRRQSGRSLERQLVTGLRATRTAPIDTESALNGPGCSRSREWAWVRRIASSIHLARALWPSGYAVGHSRQTPARLRRRTPRGTTAKELRRHAVPASMLVQLGPARARASPGRLPVSPASRHRVRHPSRFRFTLRARR